MLRLGLRLGLRGLRLGLRGLRLGLLVVGRRRAWVLCLVGLWLCRGVGLGALCLLGELSEGEDAGFDEDEFGAVALFLDVGVDLRADGLVGSLSG